jgi:hypothetical protein
VSDIVDFHLKRAAFYLIEENDGFLKVELQKMKPLNSMFPSSIFFCSIAQTLDFFYEFSGKYGQWVKASSTQLSLDIQATLVNQL